MKAARWYGAKDVRVDDIPEPVVKAGEVKIKVKWCGYCGTDIHEYAAGPIFIPGEGGHPYTGAKVPVVLGHEFSGEVLELGEGVEHLAVGDRVVVEPVVSCGVCDNCKKGNYHLCVNFACHGLSTDGGGFSEITTFRADRVYKLPESVSYEMAALVEPISVGLHAIESGNFKSGQTAVVVGAGPIGLAVIENLRVAGAKKIICVELSSARKEFALKTGVDVVLDPREVNVIEEVQKLTGGKGADIAFEVTGVQAGFDTAIDSIGTKGMLVVVSIWEKDVNFSLNKLVFGEKKITGIICYNHQFETIIDFMASGKIKADGYVTKKIYIDNIVDEGFETLIGPERDQHVKILVTPDKALL